MAPERAKAIHVLPGSLVNWRRLGAFAGIVGPVVFVTVFMPEGWLRPGYDSRSMYGSELALGPRGIIQVVNFIVYGTLLLVFARGLAAELPNGDASRWGPRLLRVCGVCLIGGGLFVMDPLPTPLAQLSWHGWLHALFGLVLSYSCSRRACSRRRWCSSSRRSSGSSGSIRGMPRARREV
jgi:hypothetical membrane protein